MITGYFGRGNAGDNAMAQGLGAYLRRRLPHDSMEALPLPASNQLSRMSRFLRAVMGSDWVVLAGGSHFHDKYGLKSWRILLQFVFVLLTARAARTKVAFAGISIGPLTTSPGRVLTSMLLSMADQVTVRDEASAQEALSLNPRSRPITGFDLALLQGARCRAPARWSAVGVSVVPYYSLFLNDADADEKMITEFAEALVTLHRTTQVDRIKIYVFCESPGYSDLPISTRLQEKLRAKGVPTELIRTQDPDQLREKMSGLSAFIGARFHSILLAYELGLPTAPIIYHEKCQALSDEIGLGSEIRLLPSDLLDHDRTTDTLKALICSPASLQASVPVDVSRRRSEGCAEKLVEAITGCRP